MRLSEELLIYSDSFDGQQILRYEMEEIEVDGIRAERSFIHTYESPMITIKDDSTGWSSPSSIHFTDDPFDEELWIKNGDVQRPPLKDYERL